MMADTILAAYCVELNAVIDIDEAQEAFFNQKEPRKRFTFQCSDESCRHMSVPPLVTGVNYSNKQAKITPHFRRNEDYEHSKNCIWGQYNSILKKIKNDKKHHVEYEKMGGKNLFRDFNDIDSEGIYDELYIGTENKKSSFLNKNIINTNDAIRQSIIYEHHRTRSLHKIVDNFRELDDEEKSIAMLTLPSLKNKNIYLNTPRVSYEKSFKCISHIRDFFHWTHIYYGEAKIYKYSKNIKGYKIFFKNYCYNYNKDNLKNKVVAFIPDTFFNNKYSQLKSELDSYALNKKPCCCYILADATNLQNENSSGYENAELVVNIDVFDIVLREITPKCR